MPVFKKGSKHSQNNYRPLSLTSLVVKMMKHLLSREVYGFLSELCKLCPAHHGFDNGHSCQTQWAKSLDKHSSTHVIYLDFSKAFDMVPHNRLSLKLGIRANLLTLTLVTTDIQRALSSSDLGRSCCHCFP